MKPGKPVFSKIREAREAIRERAMEVLDLYITNIKLAQAEGEFEVAQKSLEWLMAHMPQDDEGTRIIERDPDKGNGGGGDGKPSGPQINIGFALGGLDNRKQLPAAAEVIEVKPEKK